MSMQKALTAPHLSPDGEMMILCFEKDPMSRYRPLVFIGPPGLPEQTTELVVGRWSFSLRKAQRVGIGVYFDTYRERYGFKHPEDPTRTDADGPLPATVMAMREGDHYYGSKTFDPDAAPGVGNVAL